MIPELFKIPFFNWSVKGYGLMLMIGFLSGIWLAARRAMKVKQDPDVLINSGFVALICGVIGARAFYVIHYWQSSFANAPSPLWAVINLTSGGLEFYGGFIGAFAGILVYMRLKGMSLRLFCDIMAPSVMWGLAFGRIGCFLNGCCWGGVCATPEGAKALPWAVTFPYGSPALVRQWAKRKKTLPADLIYVSPTGDAAPLPRELLNMTPEEVNGPIRAYEQAREARRRAEADNEDLKTVNRLRRKEERAKKAADEHRLKLGLLADKVDLFGQAGPGSSKKTLSELADLAHSDACRSLPVHPAQLYGSINAMLLSLLLSAVFAVRKRHGVVAILLFLLYPLSRIVLETIRVDNPLDTFGLTISSAISLAGIALGIVGMIIVYRLPLRSPRAVAWMPPPEPQPKKK
jgi:phosphatidylglycerol:prolipoprotein diacylglycerol transferase